MADPEYLDLADALALAAEFLGGPAPVRDLGLLGSALARPATTAFGEDAYPDLWTKAAAMMQSIVLNHPLVDGNKRLGWVAARVFLALNGVETADYDIDEAERFVLAMASGELREVDEVAGGLRRLLEPDGSAT